jgi:hypothetical protein
MAAQAQQQELKEQMEQTKYPNRYHVVAVTMAIGLQRSE